MKKLLTITAFCISVCILTSCYNRMGQLMIVSTRNMDSKTDYVLLSKNVQGKAKTKKREALQMAVDKAVNQFPTGEFMKNVIVEAKTNGKKIRVTGDVWGTQPAISVTKTVNANVEFKSGDKVTYKSGSKIIEGTILGLNEKTAIVESTDGVKKEVDYSKLTKIQR